MMPATIAAALATIALTAAAAPAAADVTLIRGSYVETVATGRAAAPAVLRGARTLPASAVAPVALAPVEAAAPTHIVAAGSVLWRMDRATGEAQACWLQGTGAPGGYFIRCTPR
jgi:hypothetical protein